MDNDTKQKLAESLTAESIEILPYIPYLLQDFWELGSSPNDMTELVGEHIDTQSYQRFLDLGCGKGAVSVTLAKAFGVQVTGIDIIPEFITEANRKAIDCAVSDLTTFIVGDISKEVIQLEGFDCVIYGAVGPVLGKPDEMLPKLARVIQKGGYILLDDCYREDEVDQAAVLSSNETLTRSEWTRLFDLNKLDLIAEKKPSDNSSSYKEELTWIRTRAKELSQKYPDHRLLFEQYVRDQENEYQDLESTLIGVTWLLRKR